jgi:Subtilase family
MRTIATLVAAALAVLPAPAAPAASVGVHLARGTFRPGSTTPPAPNWFHADSIATAASGRRYLLAITSIPLGPTERLALAGAGAEILDYVPLHAYRLRVPPEDETAVRRLSFVTWLGPLPSYVKVDPRLDGLVAVSSGTVEIRVLLSAGEPAARVLDALAGSVTQASPDGKDGAWRIVARLPVATAAAALSHAAGLPEVEAIEPVRRFRPMNQDAVWVHQSFVGPSPQSTPIFDHGIFGCGQTIAVADTAQDYDSCYFRDTVNGAPPVATCGAPPCPAASPATNRRKDVLYYNWSGGPIGEEDTCPATITGTSGHGTHTSGSAAGDTAPYADCSGFTSPNRNGGDGLAPGAKLIVEELGDGLDYLNTLGGTLWNLTDVAYQSGARIHSNSWGGACYDELGSCIPGCTMPYDSYARDADLAMWTYPDLLVVTAAGNAGWFCPAPIAVGTPANAKSVLTIGATEHGANASIPADYSSSGPVEDGRLKPALAAQGQATVSAASDANLATNNCQTCSLDGSSMSAPTAAGLAALVREYYTAGFYATGARNPAQGMTPTGALLKATLLDGSVALSAGAPGPDFQAGFGRIELDRTLTFSGSSFQLRVDDHREGITTGSVVEHAYDVAAGSSFRATLVWSDYPAALLAAVARVNELKLEVVDPSGTVWFQTIDPGTGLPRQTSNPADPHDSLNVEERLVFDAPAAGRWIVRVRGLDVPWGPQPFALVVRGALSDCVPPAAPIAPFLTTPADHQVAVSWGSVPMAAAYDVYRSFGACAGGPWVPVASAVTGTSFTDGGVSGGVTYSYIVTAASDAAAACESARSPCASVVPTGDCSLAPTFHGVAGAVSSGAAGCAVHLTWDPASPYCAGDARYNVYRGTAANFVPGPTNRIARCLLGTSFTDGVDLAYGTTYWYVVRAEDASTGHGGPCRGGNEETNTATVVAAPDGLPAIGTWTDDAGDTGTAKLVPTSPWVVAATDGHTAPAVYLAPSSAGACGEVTTPALTLADPGQGPQLTFWTKHTLDYDPTGEIFGTEGSVGQVEIATGPTFSSWTRVLLTPDYPNNVEFPYNLCATTQYPARYFTGIATTYTSYAASLVNWAGGDVKIRFHVSGDLIYSGGSWWVDDIAVTKAYVPGACTTQVAGPPPVPDGGPVPGLPLLASRNGGDVAVTWDATQCPAAAINVYFGAIGSYGAFTGGRCGLVPTGSATLTLPDNVWFLAAATDGASTDGSWARGPNGNELAYSGAGAACPGTTQHVTNDACP